ncbi:MAG: EAL domain-containing protein [Agitococcus sp.]|nr:EAL domain-containing protein [Agitococcus sp.]
MRQLRVLNLEDVPTDAELVALALQMGGIVAEIKRVDSEPDFIDGLLSFDPDIILADYHVPGFGGLEALVIHNNICPEVPFIFVSGSLGEERAVATLREGATDYVLKDRMIRLPAAVTRALQECEQQRERERIRAELDAERRLMSAILNTTQAFITVVDERARIVHLNAAAVKVSGQPLDMMLGAVFWEAFMAVESQEVARKHIQVALESHSSLAEHIWRATTPTGRIILWTTGMLNTQQEQAGSLVLCGIDITDQQQAEEKAYFLDNFDLVTHLPNRKLFQRQLSVFCYDELNQGTLRVAMMVGIAKIQEIRDSYGEVVTDEILLILVERLRLWQPKHDLIARVGDSTFALALEVELESELPVLVAKILQQMNEPFDVAGRQWVLSALGGVAVYHREMEDPILLLHEAEAALHDTETEPERSYTVYTPVLSGEARGRLQLESELRAALKHNDELILYYQPQVHLVTGKVIGMEALIRWRHPRLGFLAPDRFLPIAETSGLMACLSQWVLRSACQQLQRWQQQGLTPPPIAINLSATEFASPLLPEHISTALQEFGILPHQLEVELTESASMNDPQLTISIMSTLREMGLCVSIDDFGTGYSNLSYLKRFPVDRLKIDQAFVRDILTDADDLAISQAVIAMAHQLRLEVIAEGIETWGQLAVLMEARCDVGQGYLFSVPRAGDDCPELMSRVFDLPSSLRSERRVRSA